MPYKTFMITETEKCLIYAFYYNSKTPCPSNNDGSHKLRVELGECDMAVWSETLDELRKGLPAPICACGYAFQAGDNGGGANPICIRTDTGERASKEDTGAMWWGSDYSWGVFSDEATSLWVRTPGGSWCIDSRASNCTKPDDNEHKCWIRHGEPPGIHVDKNGLTCNAGAGSIQCREYHGFLHNGFLTDHC